MTNGPYAIFTSGRNPEHIEEKEQNIIKKGEKQTMTREELFKYVGKKVFVIFKKGDRGIYGTLCFADSYNAKNFYHKIGYFYINHTEFKEYHVKEVIE